MVIFEIKFLSYRKEEENSTYPEYRVPSILLEEAVILRVESERDVVVRSVVFIRKEMLDDHSVTLGEVKKLFKEPDFIL